MENSQTLEYSDGHVLHFRKALADELILIPFYHTLVFLDNEREEGRKEDKQ